MKPTDYKPFYYITELTHECDSSERLPSGEWVPARPVSLPTWWERLRAAWLVFRGQAAAVQWASHRVTRPHTVADMEPRVEEDGGMTVSSVCRLRRNTLVHINGLPAYVESPATVRTHPANLSAVKHVLEESVCATD